MPSCKSCDATIFFVETEAGKAMPLDAKEVQIVEVDPDRQYVIGYTRGYLPHWATCPSAAQHRRKAK